MTPARKSKKHRISEQTIFLGTCIVPYLLHLLLFSIGPMIFAVYLSFHDWAVVTSPRFIGLENFTRLFTQDRVFLTSLRNSLTYTILNVPISVSTAMIAAVLLNNIKRFQAFLRTAYFLPVVTSIIACSIIWKWLYQPSFGLFNQILRLLGLPGIMWLESPRTALVSIMAMNIWKSMGFKVVLFMAGLQFIPQTYKEAALIDGANPLQVFRHITLPLLMPTTAFVMITAVIGCLQVFEPMYVMTQGGPLYATTTIVYHLYMRAFENFQMGYAASIAFVLLVIIIVLTLLQYKITKPDWEY